MSEQRTGEAVDPCARLRQALRRELSRVPGPVGPEGGWSPDTLERSWSRDENGYGYAGHALDSLNASDAVTVLARMTSHPNALSSLEAAAGLAVLGNHAGIARLRLVLTLTNSQVEFFYARAAFALLGRPVPLELAGRRSVFVELESLVDACVHATGGTP